MNFSSHCPPRIKEERLRLGLSQAQAAEKTGVSREMWGRYERGDAIPGGEVLFSFALVGADIQYLLTGESKNDSLKSMRQLSPLTKKLELLDEAHCNIVERLVDGLIKLK